MEEDNQILYNSISNQIDVFDSHEAFHHITSQLNSTYAPQGTAPFKLAVETVKRMQEKLKTKKIKEEGLLKDVITDPPTYDKIMALKSEDDLLKAIEFSKMSDNEKSERTNLIENKKVLESGDALLRIQQAKGKERIFQETLKIANTVENFNYDAYNTISSDLIEFQRKNKEATKKSFQKEIIPGIFSNHWAKFIEAGEEYVRQETGSENAYPVSYDDKCIYCRQDLQKNAFELLKKYREYCNNQSKKDVEKAEGRKRDISLPIINLPIDDNKREIENLKNDIKDSTPLPSCFDVASEIIEFSQTLKTFFQHSLEKNNNDNKIPSLSSKFKESSKNLLGEVKKIKQNITLLSENSKKQENDLNKIQNNLIPLVRKKTLNDVLSDLGTVNKIEKYIKISTCIKNLQSAQTSLTKELVEATQNMMEQGYKKHFIEECKKLHITPVEIETHGKEGDVERNLVAKTDWNKKPNLKDVLSEGEQRCVALADFLTEKMFLKESSCLVFDDPVSSVDYNHIDYIAERLVTISREKQIVVFTHDILFAGELIEKLDREHLDSKNLNNKEREYLLYRIEYDIEHDRFGVVKKQKVQDGLEKSLKDRFEEIKNIIEIGKQNVDRDLCGFTLALGGYARLRMACEFFVINNVLMNTVSPYRKNVRMKNITKIQRLDVKDAAENILPIFEKCSKFLHLQPASKKKPHPTISGLEKDLESIEKFIEETEKKIKSCY